MAKRFVWLFVALIVLGGAFAAVKSSQPQGTPDEQIRGAVRDSVDALNHGHVSTAMDIVAPDYKDSTGLNRDQLFGLARRAAGGLANGDAVLEAIHPDVEGNEATVPLTVQIHQNHGGGVQTYNVTLRMRDEDTRAYGVIPTKRWQVVAAEGLPGELQGDM